MGVEEIRNAPLFPFGAGALSLITKMSRAVNSQHIAAFTIQWPPKQTEECCPFLQFSDLCNAMFVHLEVVAVIVYKHLEREW